MSRYEMNRRSMLTRSARGMLAGGAFATGGLGLTDMLQAFEVDGSDRQFKIGACDWSIGHSGSLGAFEFARQIGLDGVEVAFPKPEGSDLRTEAGRKDTSRTVCERGATWPPERLLPDWQSPTGRSPQCR